MSYKPRMFYFGPWEYAGHFFFDERGHHPGREETNLCPWADHDIDGKLQPGCYKSDTYWRHKGPEIQGEALLHFKGGWTALSFWDRSVDERGACNSTYLAEGTFTFEEMVEMAKTRFAVRWNRHNFTVTKGVTKCLHAVPPYWNTLLECTSETCNRPLPCPAHDKC